MSSAYHPETDGTSQVGLPLKCLNFGMQQDTKRRSLVVLEPNQQKPQSKVQRCACPNLVQASSASGA
ncbi:hypothetical protein K435DRAFT_852133 [Dendrothele bispora CBS 962.96]|uniref:Uncharacterized protein n=1 Tax=Dendrothele bispora (strain CBS 962.96) TaxID=1314807 RepID=A0A4S8MKM1_DENBC|nr:hypothetical protein K435DRAFT_852133 [Dendrothele bispora CBS 962.96]